MKRKLLFGLPFVFLLNSFLSLAGTHMQQGDSAGGSLSGTYPNPSIASLPSGSTSYIQNRSTLQSGSTFYVSSGTVSGQLTVIDHGVDSIMTLNQTLAGPVKGLTEFDSQGSPQAYWGYTFTGPAGSENGIVFLDSTATEVARVETISRKAFQIGTSTGTNKLNVLGNASIGTADAASSNGLLVGSSVGIGFQSSSATLAVLSSTSTSFEVTFGTSSSLYHISISTSGHFITNGSTPVVSSCGTSPAITGNDNAGTITVGTGVTTSCTMTFSLAWGSSPVCVFSDDSTAVTGDVSSIGTTAVTFSFSASLGGGHIYYHCLGAPASGSCGGGGGCR